jgi:hypothetical protein
MLVSVIGCSHNTGSSAQGGQDGGGGYVSYSSPAEVRSAIERVLALAKEPRFEKNIYSYFATYLARAGIQFLVYRPTGTPLTVVDKIYLTSLGTLPACVSIHGEEITTGVDAAECPAGALNSAHIAALVGASPTEIREKGDCGMSTDGHADASVSKFERGATLCFSIERLQRVPPPSLQAEILALTFHEAMHLSGYGEDDAREAQADFVNFYDKNYSAAQYGDLKDALQTSVGLLYSETQMLRDILASESAIDRSVIASHLGRVYQALRDLPKWKDFMSLRLAVPKEVSSESIVAYEYSVGISLIHLAPTFLFFEPRKKFKEVEPPECKWENDPRPAYVPPATIDDRGLKKSPQSWIKLPMTDRCAKYFYDGQGISVPDLSVPHDPYLVHTDLEVVARQTLQDIGVLIQNALAVRVHGMPWSCEPYRSYTTGVREFNKLVPSSEDYEVPLFTENSQFPETLGIGKASDWSCVER